MVERVVEGKLGEEDDVQSVVVRVRGDKSNTNMADDENGNSVSKRPHMNS